ncbi:MAG: hypothetical protein WA113_01990 [Desulfitobacteriaceae bacterium]
MNTTSIAIHGDVAPRTSLFEASMFKPWTSTFVVLTALLSAFIDANSAKCSLNNFADFLAG